jgi:RecB family exonuclease
MRLSASKIKSLDQCSYKFYLNYIKHLPETTHPKTFAGTVAHEIFEFLAQKENRAELESIKKAGFDASSSKIVVQMTKDLVEKFEIIEDVADGIPQMLDLGCEVLYNKLSDPALVEYHTELEFTLRGAKYEIKGFIDLLLIYEDYALIIDYKSQGKKFAADELEFNIQALVYQMVVKQNYGKSADVDFILLRHPPTSRTRDKHIQTVPYAGEETFAGLENYLDYLQDHFDDFSLEHATSKYCCDDPKKLSFCIHVCQFKKGFNYFAATDGKEDVLTSKEKTPEFMVEAKEKGLKIVRRKYSGCPGYTRNIQRYIKAQNNKA